MMSRAERIHDSCRQLETVNSEMSTRISNVVSRLHGHRTKIELLQTQFSSLYKDIQSTRNKLMEGVPEAFAHESVRKVVDEDVCDEDEDRS